MAQGTHTSCCCLLVVWLLPLLLSLLQLALDALPQHSLPPTSPTSNTHTHTRGKLYSLSTHTHSSLLLAMLLAHNIQLTRPLIILVIITAA